MLINTIFKNTLSKESINAVVLLKKQLDLSVKAGMALTLAVSMKLVTAFILVLSIRPLPINVKYTVTVLVLFFDLFLPATISRQITNNQHIDPIYEAVFLGNRDKDKSYHILETSSLLTFWFDNFELEVTAGIILMIMFGWLGILLSLVFIYFVNLIFIKTYKKHSPLKSSIHKNKMSFFGNIIYVSAISFISLIFIRIISQSHIQNLTNVTETGSFLKHIIANTLAAVQYDTKHVNEWAVFTLIIISSVLILQYVYKYAYKRYLIWLNQNIFRSRNINIFVVRDLRRLKNISRRLNVNISLLPQFFIFAVSFITAKFYLNANIDIFLSIDLLIWFGIVSYAKYLMQGVTVLRISSEMRNIELLSLSSINKQRLVKSKYRLAYLIMGPSLFLVAILKIGIGLSTGIQLPYLLENTIAFIGLLCAGIGFILKPDARSATFDYSSEFELIRYDMGTKFINLIWRMPIRIISFIMDTFFVLFVLVNNHDSALKEEYLLF
ncbi:hypothetical protein FCS83_08355 [Oenococcus sp. UCMA 17063]|nr:hypothetical protein [Oenococcus sp. UCMA 17063]